MKKIDRRSFMIGCGLLTFSTAGIFFSGCGEDSKNTSPSTNKTPPSMQLPPVENKPLKLSIETADKTIYLNQAKFDLLKSRNYVQNEDLLIFDVDNKFYGFSNICPHEQGQLKIENANTIRCQKHTIQKYDKNGISNKAKTIQNLKSSTLTIVVLDVKTKA